MSACEEVLISSYSDQETLCQIFFHNSNTFPLGGTLSADLEDSAMLGWQYYPKFNVNP